MAMAYVPVFDGSHYESWSLKMRTFLKAIDLWDVVEKGINQEPPETSWFSHEFEGETYESSSLVEYFSAWCKNMEMRDMSALYLIQTALSHEIIPWIASATSSKEAWDMLLVKSLGGPILQARKLVDLKKEYKDMTMRDTETIHEFTGKLMELVFRMKSCGWKVKDKEVVKKILSSLPSRFDKVLVDVAETLEINVLIDCLLVHEYNMRQPVQEADLESVDVEVVEESLQEDAEILYSLNEITQHQVVSMERQREVMSLVEQNQKMLVQMQKQMVALMQHTL